MGWCSMSRRPIDRSPDLRRLRDEGYEIEVLDGHLLMKGVPYVNNAGQVARGALKCPLTLNDDVAQPPGTHVVSWEGEFPCHKDGTPITALGQPNNGTSHSFSSKPASGSYGDYYEKMTTYARILSHPANALDPSATPRTFPLVKPGDQTSVFQYVDTASSRAGITDLNKLLK